MNPDNNTMKDGWIDYNRYIPHRNLPILVYTSWGDIRKAINDDRFPLGGYYLRDCKHAMSNCHLSPMDIVFWKYENEQDMTEGKFIINHYQHQKNGEEIIKSVKQTLLQRFINLFKKL